MNKTCLLIALIGSLLFLVPPANAGDSIPMTFVRGQDVGTFRIDNRATDSTGRKVWGNGNQLLYVRLMNKDGTQGFLVSQSTGSTGNEYDARCAVTMNGTQADSVTFNATGARTILQRVNADQMLMTAGQQASEMRFVAPIAQQTGRPVFLEAAHANNVFLPYNGTSNGTEYASGTVQCTDLVKIYNTMLHQRLLAIHNGN